MYILLMHFFSDQYLVGLIFLGGCHLMYPKVTLRLTNMLEDFIYGQKVRFCPPEITSKIYLMKYFSVEFHSCAHFNSIYVCPKHMCLADVDESLEALDGGTQEDPVISPEESSIPNQSELCSMSAVSKRLDQHI